MVVREINRRDALPYIKEYHYLHRGCVITKGYGLFVSDSVLAECVGIAAFGPGVSTTLPKKLFGSKGEAYRKLIIDFNRMWVRDEMPKNTESWFIGQALKILPKPAIVCAYAQPEVGHVGTIYQATGWLYLGKGRDSRSMQIDPAKHRRNFTRRLKKNPEIRKTLRQGKMDGIVTEKLVEYSGKHLYVKILGSRKFVRQAMADLVIPAKEYPKKKPAECRNFQVDTPRH